MFNQIVKTILGLSLLVGIAGATPLSNTLTAGLFTFSDITCTGNGCGDITWSAAAVSTSEYGGISSITFADNGSTDMDLAHAGMDFKYVVTYSGVDPRSGYVPLGVNVSTLTTPDFLGFKPNVETSGPFTFDPLLLDVKESVGFDSYSGVVGPGTITTTFTAIDAPEPLSLGLSSLAFGMLLIGALRRNALKRV